ncbi:helix-turn-helix domain-containing protein [Streptomyces sp. NPDC054887]
MTTPADIASPREGQRAGVQDPQPSNGSTLRTGGGLILTSGPDCRRAHVQAWLCLLRAVCRRAAAQLIASPPLPMTAVATGCGFGSPEALRQALSRRYGISPSRYRATARRPDQGLSP